MTDEEKALRLEALTEMFIGFGQPIVKERLRYYGNLTQFIPLGVYKQACRSAAVTATSGFVPSPGQIVKAALELAPGGYTPGQGTSLPRWYRAQLGHAKQAEGPQEIGARAGGAVQAGEMTKAAGWWE
jgi:hypothetical protein